MSYLLISWLINTLSMLIGSFFIMVGISYFLKYFYNSHFTFWGKCEMYLVILWIILGLSIALG